LTSSSIGKVPLSKRMLLLFGLSEMPLSVATLPVLAFIPNYYIQDLGLSAALVGSAMLLARLLDVASDPVVGILSDRTRTRYGRRRIWMAAGLPVSMIGVYTLFFPPADASIAWFFAATSALWLGWTMVFIPYYAWAAELSNDYNERSQITGWRTSLGLVATILAQLIPTAAALWFGFGGTPAVVSIMGVMLLILLPITLGLTIFSIPEPQNQHQAKSQINLLSGFKLMLGNGPFKRLVTAFFIVFLGMAISASLFIFFVRGVLGEESAGISVLFVNYIATLLGVPFWIWLSKRIGKHRAWMCSLLLVVVSNPLLFLLGKGDLPYLFGIIAVTGFAVGATAPLANSMKADVVDLDTLNVGENRAGLFFASWSMTMKLAMAVGPALAFWVIDAFGFKPAPGLIADPTQSLVLTSAYVISPIICSITAAALMWNYPITEAVQRAFREKLEQRTAPSES
jgi:glycoside/pentoside/hexuronide:cation symporter, GPH family